MNDIHLKVLKLKVSKEKMNLKKRIYEEFTIIKMFSTSTKNVLHRCLWFQHKH